MCGWGSGLTRLREKPEWYASEPLYCAIFTESIQVAIKYLRQVMVQGVREKLLKVSAYAYQCNMC